jgi:hypothetical protein
MTQERAPHHGLAQVAQVELAFVGLNRKRHVSAFPRLVKFCTKRFRGNARGNGALTVRPVGGM